MAMSDAERIREAHALAEERAIKDVGECRSPGAIHWLRAIEKAKADGTLWKSPPLREQLRRHYKRLGL